MARGRVDSRAFRRVRHRLRETFAMGRANTGGDGFGRGKRHHGRDRPPTEAFRNPARLVDQIDVGTDRTATEGELTEGEGPRIIDERWTINSPPNEDSAGQILTGNERSTRRISVSHKKNLRGMSGGPWHPCLQNA